MTSSVGAILWQSYMISHPEDNILILGYIRQLIENIYNLDAPIDIQQLCYNYYGPFEDIPMIGDRVKLKSKQIGTIRYIGTPTFSKEELIGIELDTYYVNGGNGTVKGEELFKTSPGFSYFVKRDSIESVCHILSDNKFYFKEGQYALLKGLLRIPKFNGKIVRLIAFVERKGRWKVKLLNAKQEKKYLGCLEENLQIFAWKPLCKMKDLLHNIPNINDKIMLRNLKIATVSSLNIFVYIKMDLKDEDDESDDVLKCHLSNIGPPSANEIKEKQICFVYLPEIGEKVKHFSFDDEEQTGVVQYYDADIMIQCQYTDDNHQYETVDIDVKHLQLCICSLFKWKYIINDVFVGDKVKTWDGEIGEIVYKKEGDIGLVLDQWSPNGTPGYKYGFNIINGHRYLVKIEELTEIIFAVKGTVSL